LDEQFKRTILRHEGELGTVLDAVLGFEAGDFDAATRHGIPIQRVQDAFWEAAESSAAMMTGLQAATAH
jgi:hypothetical protein